MRNVCLEDIFLHPITQKSLERSGTAHAIAVAEYAYMFAKRYDVNPDHATKAALLHDIGHYTWYRDGEWDYELYKESDIHALNYPPLIDLTIRLKWGIPKNTGVTARYGLGYPRSSCG